MSSNDENRSNVIAGAITFPTNSGENVRSVPVQPRQPKNLQGLLRFAMEATKAEDAPGNSNLGPMDEERRKFLEDALKNLTVDLAQVIRKSLETLTNTEKIRSIQLGEQLPEDVKSAFENLLEIIDDIDIANDFFKMGGFAIFPICYGSENDEIRACASSVLGEVCQNNPRCQETALQCGLLEILLDLVQVERGATLAKCLYAISCMVREFPPACERLVASGACDALVATLRAPEAAAKTKAAFLLRYLVLHHSQARERISSLNVVKPIAEQIRSGTDETTEHFLNILISLTDSSNEQVLRQCRDPEVDLKRILENHLRNPKIDEDECREEKEYCQELLKKVFENCPDVDSVQECTDR